MRILASPIYQIKVEESAAAAAALKRSTAPPAPQEGAATVAPAAKKRPAVLERTSSHLNHLKIRRQSLAYRRAMLSTAKYSLRASSSCPDIYRNAISGKHFIHPKEVASTKCVLGGTDWQHITDVHGGLIYDSFWKKHYLLLTPDP